MSLYELFLLAHLLLFVYWLGGDLGVFYSSGFVVDKTLTREARLTAAKIMLGCDLVPRICMSLMLTVGGILSHYMGIEHAAWQFIAIIVLGPFWLAMVIVLHFKHHAWYIQSLTKIDFSFRCLVIFAIIVSCLSADLADVPWWLIIKLGGFAFLVFCGLMIRIKIKDFSATYVKLLNNTYGERDNQAMARSLNRVRPWVITIWVVLILEAYLGIAKPV